MLSKSLYKSTIQGDLQKAVLSAQNARHFAVPVAEASGTAPEVVSSDNQELEGAKKLRKEPRFLEMVQLFVRRASKLSDVPYDRRKYYKECDSILSVNFPIIKDDGSIEKITGYRA